MTILTIMKIFCQNDTSCQNDYYICTTNVKDYGKILVFNGSRFYQIAKE